MNRSEDEPFRICFVCLGNICRSPTAEGIMRSLVDDAGLSASIEVHSAGTAGWHRGELPDDRARAEARRRGIDLTSRASTFHPGDASFYDLVLAMDRANERDLRDRTDPTLHERIARLRTFDPALAPTDPWDGDGPDPWTGGEDGFIEVYDLIDAACRGLLVHIQENQLV
jgi:protein-tyrosine phosphatase